MSLDAWQGSLAALIAHGASPLTAPPSLDDPALSADERAWLASARGSRGLRVTCDVQRFWRDQRLRGAAPFTLRSLAPAEADALVARYLDERVAFTQFFFPEARAFLSWLLSRPELSVHARSIARWELANLEATDGAEPGEGARLACSPFAALIAFFAPIEEVLGSVLKGVPLPPVHAEPRWYFVAPGLRMRDATEAERDLWTRLEQGPADRGEREEEAAQALLEAGILVSVP